MADLTTKTRMVSFDEIPGYAERLKTLVNEIIDAHEDLSIVEVLADDENNYSAYISYKGHTDWVFMASVESNSSLAYFYVMVKGFDDNYSQLKYTGSPLMVSLAEDYFVAEVTYSESDLMIVSVVKPDGAVTALMLALSVVDQFTGIEKIIGTVPTVSNYFFTDSSFYLVDGSVTTEVKFDKNANGLPLNGGSVAVPVVLYTTSSEAPLSGFVGGKPLLYRIYRDNELSLFSTRFKRFTINGQTFITLGNNYCFRIG